MATVQVRPGDSVDVALRKLRKALEKDGVMRDCRRHDFFVGPSRRRRMKARIARVRREA